MDENDIARMVRDALTYVGGLNESYLRIRCHRGVIVLAGMAFTEAQRREAEDIARAIPGVRRVVNEITLVGARGG